jgi:hypothetical protein
MITPGYLLHPTPAGLTCLCIALYPEHIHFLVRVPAQSELVFVTSEIGVERHSTIEARRSIAGAAGEKRGVS